MRLWKGVCEMAKSIAEKDWCKHFRECLAPSTGCIRQAQASCSEFIRLEKAAESPCPLCLGGKCDLPQYRGHMKNIEICDGESACPLSSLRSTIPVRDFHEGVVYPENFPRGLTATEIVRSLRKENL